MPGWDLSRGFFSSILQSSFCPYYVILNISPQGFIEISLNS